MTPDLWIFLGKSFALCIGVSVVGVGIGYAMAWAMGPTGEGD